MEINNKVELQVFVSYGRDDAKKLDALKEELIKHKGKLNYFIDSESIPGGEDWRKKIFEAIDNAHIFLFCLSQNSIKSVNCHLELFYANLKGKYFFPIRFEEIDDIKNSLDQFLTDLK